MVDTLINIIKKLIPKTIFIRLQPLYHWLLSFMAPIVYGQPSNKLVVIGVTGTKGKSTVCYLLARILEEAGNKVGMSSGIILKVGEKEWLNDYKMTMPGRFKQQKLLSDMVRAGCEYAIIETTSEGIKQYRHVGINYDVVLFTNLYPEHIESHGSFDKYREAKGKLFYHLTQKPKKKFFNKKISVVNIDDKNADYFSYFPADEKYGYSLYDYETKESSSEIKNFKTENLNLNESGSSFSIGDSKFKINLLGEMNIYNAMASISAAKSLGIDDDIINSALFKIKVIPGRMEFIDEGQDYKVIVDYAHDPESLRQLFLTIKKLNLVKVDGKIIHVFGAPGGGRDKSKRAVMGSVSDQNTDIIILTNDDPYQEDYDEITNQINQGVSETKQVHTIINRREAIEKAISLAGNGDLVVITGKGSEQVIMLNDGKHKWDDRQVVKELLKA